MKKILYFLVPAVLLFHDSIGQLTMNKAIIKAVTQSPAYKLAVTRKDLKYYQFLSFKSGYKPQVTLYGNLPVYNKQYFAVRQPDGTISYQSINQNMSNVGFALRQKIPFTGGEISLNTALARFDDFDAKIKQYNATPIFLQLNQPLFAVNELKWNKKIQPLVYEESRKEYAFELEQISQETVDFYFDVLDAKNNVSAATINLQNTKVNYEIEQKRIPMGTTTEDRLLQLQLQVLNSRKSLEKEQYNLQVALLSLQIYIGLKDTGMIKVVLPEDIKRLNIDPELALKYVRANRPEYIAFERSSLEAGLSVAKAKSAKNSVQLTATLGLNNAGTRFGTVYNDPKMQQSASIGFSIPIMDWGRSKAALQAAKANAQLTAFNNELEEINLERKTRTIIKSFELLKKNVLISRQADSIALKRYGIANELFKQGKLTISELNIAQSEKDNSTHSYLAALRSYWKSFYELRKLTLYNFEKDKPISYLSN